MNMKHLMVLALMILGLVATSLTAAAMPEIVEVQLDDNVLYESGSQFMEDLDYGETLELEVRVRTDEDWDDAEISAWIRGIDINEKVSESSKVFDIRANRTRTEKLRLSFSDRLDEDTYTLRVEFASRNGQSVMKTYELDIGGERDHVVIKDVTTSPYGSVVAGRALLTTVRVENRGTDDQDDVKVQVSIPALGLQVVDWIDDLEQKGDDDVQSTEEMFLRLPQCARAGVYEMEVRVWYNDGDDYTTKTMPITVLSDETCGMNAPDQKSGKTFVSIAAETQNVMAGGSVATYPVTITNTGAARTFTIGVTGGDWGTFTVAPTNVVTVGDDETRTVYVQVSAGANAPAGEHIFGVSMSTDGEVVKEVTLKANVVSGSSMSSASFKRTLEVGLIVLVVILVILGLIIGFNKLKGDDDGDEGQSYY